MSNIDPTAVSWCEKHWSPYRLGYGYGLAATLLIIQACLNNAEFMAEAGWDPQTGTLATIDGVNQAITNHNPTCCYLGDHAMDLILQQCLKPSVNKEPL